MGHRRVDSLPKTHRWRKLVEALGAFSGDAQQLERVVASTLEGVRERFLRVEAEPSVFASFKYLVTLAVASRTEEPSNLLASLGGDKPTGDSPIALACALIKFLERHTGSPEYAAIAGAAACDAISRWHRINVSQTGQLFGHELEPFLAWRKLSSGAGFCEIARLYFSGLTGRYLRYFLEREASRSMVGLFERDEFEKQLAAHVDDVSQHAFETAKITQSFAAGWFNKHAKSGVPTDREITTFLTLAFGKMRAELQREAGGQ